MKKRFGIFIITIAFLTPIFASAAGSQFYYAGWLPFWKKESGTKDVLLHLEKLHEISPFSYEVNPDGTLRDVLQIHEGVWPEWLSTIRKANIKIIPSIAWFDGNGLHTLLSNTKSRRAHEDIIAKLVMDENFDGIDIDYESKLAKTSPYFSLLVEGLALRLHPHNKILSCTIEARTPLNSLRNQLAPGEKPAYANDYAVLNKYCDEVRIMAYDQGTIDVKLNAAKGNGNLYAPVADLAWSEKVIKEAIKTINPKKVMLGIPTYGYEYGVTWDNGVTTYRRLRSVNFLTALDRADIVKATTMRSSAGELSFTYTTSTFIEVASILRSNVTSTLPTGVSPQASNSTPSVTRFVSVSDAEAVNQKIQLAKKYGLRGVALFKFDGEFDPLIWDKMTPRTSIAFTRNLTIGANGEDVSALQQFLITKGFLKTSAPTGYFGPQTKAALSAWQKSVGISPSSGIFGPVSREKINTATQ